MGQRKRDFNGRTKIKDQTINGQDQFSKLPEPLIIYILSMLEMKDAVRTTILAKYWKDLWTQVDTIVFDRFLGNENEEDMSFEQRFELRKTNDEKWMSFVDKTLIKCTGRIKMFALNSFAELSVTILEKWISYVLNKKVESLRLSLYGDVPDCVFQNSTVTELELVNVKVSRSPTVSLRKLKSLVLESVFVDDDFIEKMLIGCPVLETIVLRNLSGVFRLNVLSLSVKMLWDFGSGDDVCEIRVPWLQELKFSRRFPYTRFELVKVSSLLKSSISFDNYVPAIDENKEGLEFHIWVTEYVKALSIVSDLIIGSEAIQVLSWLKLSGTPSPLFMCKHLSIKTYLWKFDLPGIACLLENAPHLETLVIKVVDDWQDALPLSQTEKLFQNGDPHLSMPSGNFLHLNSVKIDYSRHSCGDATENIHEKCFDLKLVEFLMRSVVILGKLVLCSSRCRSCFSTGTDPDCSFAYVRRLALKLLVKYLFGNGAAGASWELEVRDCTYSFTFPNYASILPAFA